MSISSDNVYIPVMWPESQDLMDKEDFRENCFLINDEKGLNQFGSSAYMCNKEWLDKATGTLADLVVIDASRDIVHYFKVPINTNVEDFLNKNHINYNNCQWLLCNYLTVNKHY